MQAAIALVIAAICADVSLFLAGVEPLAATVAGIGVLAFGIFLKSIKA